MSATDTDRYEWESISGDEEEQVKASFAESSFYRKLIRTKPFLITLPVTFTPSYRDRVRNMPLRQDDVWIVTYPKCGTTWTQELTWLILNEANTAEAEHRYLYERSPFIDFPMLRYESPEAVDKFFDGLEALASPRVIKTHFPFELLPAGLLDTCRVIFVCRNVKDVVVSYFHHESLLKTHGLVCDFEKYARDIFKPALCCHGGYFQMLESGWSRRGRKSMLFLWYEEMKKDQPAAIRRIADFLGVALSTETVASIDSFARFENYKRKSTVNKPNEVWNEGKGEFVRKGVVGDWANMFSSELTAEYDAWARGELARLGITDAKIIEYFQLQN